MFTTFKHDGRELRVEGVSLEGIADACGTPTYVYSRQALVESYKSIDAAFAEVPHTICFAMKANGNLAVASAFAGLGAGADIVSGGELYKALKAGIPAERIVFAGVGKTVPEIVYALESGIRMFNVESEGELEAIERVAEQAGVVAPVAVRVNPDVDPDTNPYISTGMKKHKFGVVAEQAIQLYHHAGQSNHLEAIGIQFHIGSQLLKSQPIIEATERVLALATKVRSLGVSLRYLDIGGGLGISYGHDEPEGPEALARAIVPQVKQSGLHLLLEPGRYLVGNAGCLLTRVLYVKDNGHKKFVIVDAGMNDLIRPSLYDAYHAIEPVRPRAEQETVDVVGPVCESGDFFAHSRDLPRMEPGDLVAIMSAGAYGFTMASNYNARPRPAEVLVADGQARVVRRRETYEDLVRWEESF